MMRRLLIQRKCLTLLRLLIVCALTLCMGCGGERFHSPEGYNMARPKQLQLGKVLNEISGLAYDPRSNTLLAISDSKEKVFQMDFARPKLKDLTDKFVARPHDFEDLVFLDSVVYVLVSDGTLMAVTPGATDTSGTRIYETPFTGKNDFETLYFDPTVNSLILMCKSCAHEKGQDFRTAFRFDLKTRTFDTAAFFRLDESKVKELLKSDDADLKPSAAAIHPVNKRLYILNSASNILVVADTRGHIIEAYVLNPDQHPQAEGIAFAPNGDMYISNEGKYGVATLQIYPYASGTKKKM